ncbi:MAG: metallophosphoesterase [Verrucomicrobiota bacterium]
MIEFIHISDTHFGPDADHSIRGSRPYRRTAEVVKEINALPFSPDFVMHTGDIVNEPEAAAYQMAAEVLGQLESPIHYVTGNHDDPEMIREHMGVQEPNSLSDDAGRLCYHFPMGEGIEAFILDAKVPEKEGPHGFLPQEQIDAFAEAQREFEHIALFLHYPLLPIGSKWIDEFLLVRNGGTVHEFLRDEIGSRLRGVFFGHLHRGLQLYRDGILYSGVASSVCQFPSDPQSATCEYLPDCNLAFNHISMSPEATLVKEYSVPIPWKR